MEISPEIQESIDCSVLCWLATASAEGVPNVSPKEIFVAYGSDSILVANIASPQTVRNIRENPQVCISFIDVLVQKGFQLKGKAEIVGKSSPDFSALEAVLLPLTEGKFPFASVTRITLESAKPIIAPRYRFYPETTEAEQIESARKSYNL